VITADDIVEQLTREIAARAKMEPDEIKPHAHFVRDLGLNSLDMLTVLAFAEKAFAVRFPDDKLPELATLAKLTEAVRVYQQKVVER